MTVLFPMVTLCTYSLKIDHTGLQIMLIRKPNQHNQIAVIGHQQYVIYGPCFPTVGKKNGQNLRKGPRVSSIQFRGKLYLNLNYDSLIPSSISHHFTQLLVTLVIIMHEADMAL